MHKDNARAVRFTVSLGVATAAIAVTILFLFGEPVSNLIRIAGILTIVTLFGAFARFSSPSRQLGAREEFVSTVGRWSTFLLVLTGAIAAYGLAGNSLVQLKIPDDNPVKIAADIAGVITLGAVILLAPMFAVLSLGFKFADSFLSLHRRIVRRR